MSNKEESDPGLRGRQGEIKNSVQKFTRTEKQDSRPADVQQDKNHAGNVNRAWKRERGYGPDSKN